MKQFSEMAVYYFVVKSNMAASMTLPICGSST